ncbi:acylneuraminate cytidylyltransferase family protein [Desulforhopalus sp. 52FAK]
MVQKYIALICAREGSKGIPGKNIKLLGGRPLIGWAIKKALEVERIERVIVSTDSEKIAEVAIGQGAEVPFLRPLEFAQDDSPEWEVWRHTLDFLANQQHEFDGLVVVPPTAPLRIAEDIDNCIDEFEKGNVDVIITVSDAHRSPYFNMVTKNENSFNSLVIPTIEKISRRQDAPEVFDMTTVAYVVRPQFIRERSGIFQGRVRSVHIPPERALDIDTPLDFKFAEYLVAQNEEKTS